MLNTAIILGGAAITTNASTPWEIIDYGKAVINANTETVYQSVSLSGELSGTPVEGDVVFAAVCCDGSPTYFVPENFTSRWASGDALPRCSLSTYAMTSSPIASMNVGPELTLKSFVIWAIVRGCKLSTFLDNTVASVAWANSITPNPPAVTALTANTLSVAVGFRDDNDLSSAGTAPAGWDFYSDFADTGQAFLDGNGCSGGMAMRVVTSTGSVNPSVMILPSNNDDTWAVHMLVRHIDAEDP